MKQAECEDCGAMVDMSPELYQTVRSLRQALGGNDVKTRCAGCGTRWEKRQSRKALDEEQKRENNLKAPNGAKFEW